MPSAHSPSSFFYSPRCWPGFRISSMSTPLWRPKPGKPGYQSILLHADLRCFRPRLFLLLDHGCDPAGSPRFSANTAFADFSAPVPSHRARTIIFRMRFVIEGRRLVYTYGIVTLAILTAILLTVFDGVYRQADSALRRRRVPGVHAFRRAGMVRHWFKKARGRIGERGAFINGLGAFVNRDNCLCRAGGEVRGRRLDHAAVFIPLLVVMFRICAPPLSLRARAKHCARSLLQPAAQSLSPIAVVPLDRWRPHLQTRFGVCQSHHIRNYCASCGTGRAFRTLESGMGALCRWSISRRRAGPYPNC